jgi:hypothetical protein
MTVARNDPCPCGSGKKYKKCCLGRGGAGRRRQVKIGSIAAVAVLVAAAAAAVLSGREAAGLVAAVGLLGVGAYLFFADPPPPTQGSNPGAINFGG